MRPLVTGASGFIGRVLCAQLLKRGHQVSALVRRPGSEPAGTERVPGLPCLGGRRSGRGAAHRLCLHRGHRRCWRRAAHEETQLPVGTPYGRSKQQGEPLILGSGLPAVVIRPSHVYGRGGWYANELVARLRGPGRLAVIGRGRNMWDVVHVEDVASALVLAGERGPAPISHVVDDHPISYGDSWR